MQKYAQIFINMHKICSKYALNMQHAHLKSVTVTVTVSELHNLYATNYAVNMQ
jgi:hypothetical protein